MPKFARPTSYNGRQGNQDWTGDVRFATLPETLAGASNQIAISPATFAAAATGFVAPATTTIDGKVFLATNAQAVTGTVTTNYAINPASLTARLAAPGPIGGTTPGAGTFTAVNASSIGATTPGSGVFTDIESMAIGASSPGTGVFTTLQATTIGGVTPGAGHFTTLTSTLATTLGSTAGSAVAIGNSTGTLGFFGSAGTTQVVQGVITNNVTPGGTTGTIANFTSLTVYATDAPTIQNDIYQLALSLQGVIAALRGYGIL